MSGGHAIVVGAGHNGLVCAIRLARSGLRVTVLEAADHVGGACVTEYPFAAAPGVGCSTGAYLLGLMPPEIIGELGLDLRLIRRDPHYFLPTTDGRYLLFGSDPADLRRQFERFFSAQDWIANVALTEEITAIRDDLAPSWLAEPLSLEETADRYLRPGLRETYIDLCRGSIADYLDRFDFRSDLLRAMYAVTDALSGLSRGYRDPGTGHNFLVHNMCRLPGADGTWMIAAGGMGAVTAGLARLAAEAGATIRTGAEVNEIRVQNGRAVGVRLADGQELDAEVVVSGADPTRTAALLGPAIPAIERTEIREKSPKGMTLKLNLCLREIPQFACLKSVPSDFGPTIHLLPDERNVLADLDRAHADARAGKLPEFPPIEWYIHSTVDPSLRDAEGRHSAALFVQWVPYDLAEGTWEERGPRYAEHLLGICDRFAPGTSDLVEDMLILPPPAIERRFGITGGHIHHLDNGVATTDRIGYRSSVEGVYRCGAGCHPAGSVIGAAGWNAAACVISEV